MNFALDISVWAFNATDVFGKKNSGLAHLIKVFVFFAGKSIYGRKFDDENFVLKHTGPGMCYSFQFGRCSSSTLLNRLESFIKICHN